MRLLVLMVAVLAIIGSASDAKAQATSGVIDYSADDSAMNRAIAEARRTLPVFWRRADDPDVSSGMVKVALDADDGSVEHIWVSAPRREGSSIAGVLANAPRAISNLRLGSPIRVGEERITDWSYEFDGRLWGGYTLRAMLPDIPRASAAELRRYLSDTPLEPALH